MCFGIRFLISFALMGALSAVLLKERSTGQYVTDTGKKQFAGTALGLVADVEAATEFTLDKVPNSPNGVFITKQGTKMVFDYARPGNPSSEVYLHPLHSQQNQQFMVVRDGDGYYQIVMLNDSKKYLRYDASRKEFMSGALVPEAGFLLVNKEKKEPKHQDVHVIHEHESDKPKSCCCNNNSSSDYH